MAHKRKIKLHTATPVESSTGEAGNSELALLEKGQVFVHAHGGFASDCNPLCGHYKVGEQLTRYNPGTHKLESVTPLKSAERK